MSARDWIQLLTLSTLWGGSFFFVALTVPHLPALTIVLARVALAALVLALALRLLRVAAPRGARAWGALAVMGLVNNAIPFTLFAFAQSQIAGGLAAILNATTPIFAALAAHVASKDERLTPRRALGVAAGFVGVAVLIGAGLGEGTLIAQLACLGAALSYGLSSVWARRFRAMGLRPLQVALGQLISATLILLPLVLLIDRPWSLPLPPPSALAALAGLALLSTALAYGLYFDLIARSGAVVASSVTFLVPVSALALGVLFLDEIILPRHLAGLALIALGLAILDGRLGARLRLWRA